MAASSIRSKATGNEKEGTQAFSRAESCSDSDDESEVRQKDQSDAPDRAIIKEVRSTSANNFQPSSAPAVLYKTKKREKKLKKLKKHEDKTLKLLLAVVKTASNIENSLTDPSSGNEDVLTKSLLEHEKFLEKLSHYIRNGKAAFLDRSIPIGLLRAIDQYEDPYRWIQREVVHKFRHANAELGDALRNIGSFQSTLQSILLGSKPITNLSPTIAACPELSVPLQMDPAISALLEKFHQ